jgi:hypothetical protein
MDFELQAVRIVPDISSASLAFADQEENHYVVLAREDTLGSEARPDLGNIYVERDDHCWGGYGGIDLVSLRRRSLTVALSAKMAVRVGNYTMLRVSFDIDDTRLHSVRDCLVKIMQGHEAQLQLLA